jgi:anti-sigma28 factor (negative regulator of flagellin synthesis)
MDPFDNPRLVKRPTEDPAEPANKTEIREAQESGNQPIDSESPIDDARREKIEGLKKAVADGTYTVSAEEVARKLIEHMLEPKE